MALLKNEYEISLWEDYVVDADGSTPEHFRERKIAVIGSHQMTAQSRATEPKLVNNINGTNTLTFKMYYTYIDNETGERKDNPFMKLMVNERKIKCKWKGKWYDFIIKNISENSDNKSITYTCKDQFINELSKTGFELEFSNELQNNQGTVDELGEKIVEGTDWTIGGADIIQQTAEEPLYKVEVKNSFTAINSLTNEEKIIDTKKIIYVFYSVVDKQSPKIQFIYNENDIYETDINSQLLLSSNSFHFDGEWLKDGDDKNVRVNSETIFTITGDALLSNYRGERLVEKQVQEFDPLTEQYCYLYKDTTNNKEIYGIETTEFRSPITVLNLLANTSNFSHLEGWHIISPMFKLYPLINAELTTFAKAKSYLRLSGNCYNSGFQTATSYLPEDGFKKGEEYICRLKAMTNLNGAPSGTYISSAPTISIQPYNDSFEPTGSQYFSVGEFDEKDDNWLEATLTCTTSITRSRITVGDIGFFVKVGDNIIWLEDIQFFQKAKDEKGNTIYPGDMATQSVARVYYKYFYKDTGVISASEIDWLYASDTRWNNENLEPIYNKDYVKIRSIEGKNSNRFNLLQSLCETFECYVDFNIDHIEETGELVYENGKPKKSIYFKKDTGQETGLSFVYGIDLKTISRTITSDQITTKIIVKPNTNEFAEDGSCEIARSEENYPRENFILNFDYYINQGLIDGGQLNKDLYLSPDGYYYQLSNTNKQYLEIVEEMTPKKTELNRLEGLIETYSPYIISLDNQISTDTVDLCKLIGLDNKHTYTDEQLSKYFVDYLKDNPEYTTAESLYINICTNNELLTVYQKQVADLNTSIEVLKDYIEEKEARLDELINDLKIIHEKFYHKYSRYIQEGSWTSEDYIDNNLYYLDAVDVAYTSSRPQISYNISVLRLSALEEFKNKEFNKGDICYIEDTEFFGYLKNHITPYKEKVLITELTSNFDSPEKDSFKVQNYKTQFEDLFQRITATTQSLQYASGSYQRAADVVTQDGTIKPETLQNSININNNLVFSSVNDVVTKDNTGITVKNTTDPSEMTKLTANGLFVSTDGGKSWKNAVRAGGVAVENLTSGAISTNNIVILNGSSAALRWDKLGISAYEQNTNDDGLLSGVNLNTYTRHDQFGFYGVRGITNFNPVISEGEGENKKVGTELIEEKAKFGFLWDRFFLKNNDGSGSVRISDRDDIGVYATKEIDGVEVEVNRIKIGRLNDGAPYLYGIRFRDDDGKTSLETDNTGQLWLRNKINVSDNTNGKYNITLGLDESRPLGDSFEFQTKSFTTDNEGKIVLSEEEKGDINIIKIINSATQEEVKDYIKVENSITIPSLVYTEVDIEYKQSIQVSEVINTNNNFIVYEDGSIQATRGTFSGTLVAASGTFSGTLAAATGSFEGEIIATSGTIGPMEINKDELILNLANIRIVGEHIDDDGNKSITDVIVFDSETGSASFTGGGSFAGNIEAKSGTIGGFTIFDSQLVSNSGGIILNGAEDKIIANNIELGIGATIANYIKLGNGYILNPDVNNRYFIGVDSNEDGQYEISLTNDGILNLGNLKADGSNSTISGANWSISPDYATFKHINAQAGTIENVVFTNSSTQSVGGSMIFRPSAKIELIDVENNIIDIIDGEEGSFKNSDFIYVIDVNGEKSQAQLIKEDEEGYYKILYLPGQNILKEPVSMINLGSYNNSTDINGSLDNNLIIGINPNLYIGNGTERDENFLFRNGISFLSSSFNKKTNKIEFGNLPHLYIGNLNVLSTSIPVSGYGFYGDNVYLKGSIVTDGTDVSAGINTNSEIKNTEHYKENPSSIIFWGGAPFENEQYHIERSNFIVDEEGNLFAKDGIFQGSIISDAVIEGADVYALRLHGGSEGDPGELSIYNTSKGIVFKDYIKNEKGEDVYPEAGKDYDGIELFRIQGDGLTLAGATVPFLQTISNNIAFSGNHIITDDFITNKGNDGNRIKILESNLWFQNENINSEQATVTNEIGLGLKNKALVIKTEIKDKDSVTEEELLLSELSGTTINNNIKFSDKIEYKLTSNGYDIYIY